MRLIQSAHEKEVGDLLNHLERIGNATRPKGIPDRVDFGAKFPRQHAFPIDLLRKLISEYLTNYKAVLLEVSPIPFSPDMRSRNIPTI